MDSIPESVSKFPGVGNGNPFQVSCLENSKDRGAWWATVPGATKSWMRLSPHSLTNCYLKKKKNDSVMFPLRFPFLSALVRVPQVPEDSLLMTPLRFLANIYQSD